jgi:hypothetical protein
MSTRDYFCSVNSIDPISAVVGSNDGRLVDALIEKYSSQYDADELKDEYVCEAIEERREWAESMIKCTSPPKKEPGCWHYFFEDLALHFGLEPDSELPFNEGWKHYYSWSPYRKLIKKHISRQSMKSLGYLESGRPLRGKKVEHDGCVFAWLSPEEVRELHHSLSALDRTVITDDWIDFHETLTESLQIVSSQSKYLFMGAQ